MNATRARLLALRVALVLAFVPWLVQPGVIQPDTKVDLVVSGTVADGQVVAGLRDSRRPKTEHLVLTLD